MRDDKRKVTAQTLWSVLLVAATAITSIHAGCERLDDIASEENIRKALIASIPEFVELQRQLNRALAGRLPHTLRRRPQRLAIDLTLIPDHGEPFRDESEVDRSQAKDGTSHFHASATADVILKGQRFTVALTAVATGEAMKDVLQRLLRQARSVGVQARLVLLDRGFSSGDVIRSLQAARQPFLMPAVIRGKKTNDPRGPSGPRVFAAMKRSGWFESTITSGSKRTATVSICVSCRNYRGPVEAARALGPDLRVLGRGWPVVRVDPRDLPDEIRDRVELSTDEPGSRSDDDPASGIAAAVRGAGVAAAQQVAMAPLRGAVDPSARRAFDPAGAAEAAGDAPLAT
jgi:hypothetical protein